MLFHSNANVPFILFHFIKTVECYLKFFFFSVYYVFLLQISSVDEGCRQENPFSTICVLVGIFVHNGGSLWINKVNIAKLATPLI